MLNSNRNLRNLTLLVACLAIMSIAYAWVSDYVLELTIITDRQEEYVQYIELTEKAFTNLRNDPANEIKPWLIEARKQYADEIGYRKEIYGSENYKMVVIAKYSFIVKEKSSGRVLLSK